MPLLPYESSFALDHSASSGSHQVESPAVGSLAYDLGRDEYGLRFDDAASFSGWLAREKREKGVEYSRHKVERDTRQPPEWSTRTTYVCGRKGNGRSTYNPKDGSNRKISPKRINCPSRVVVKTYPGTRQHLVRYTVGHNHELGEQNLKFTRLPDEAKVKVKMMVRLGIERQKIMAELQSSTGIITRENLITPQDVRRIEREVEENICRFARDDIASLRKWVEKLKNEGHYVLLKCKDERVPGFDSDIFILIIQTTYQRDCWLKWGSRFAGLDATHNTTFYQNMHLFTIMCRDNWGKGMPAAWLISSSGRQSAIQSFLNIIHSLSPSVRPRYFMSDKDHAQMNAILIVYPMTALFLCWWHVLRAWRQHFNTHAFPELWTLMRKWIRVTDQATFDSIWERIKSIAPASVIEYLEQYWMGDVKLWSGIYRTERDVFALCDTNMLVEAWHRLLKHYFMASKHGRRVDQLVYVLTSMAVPYFRQRHLRQRLGFEGADVAQAEVDAAMRAGETIKKEDIVPDEELEQVYSVRSQTHRDRVYVVHVGDASNCTCPAFPRVLYCKHIDATRRHFFPKLDLRTLSVADLDAESGNAEDEPCDVDDNPNAPETADVTSVTEHPPPDHHDPSATPSPDPALTDRLQSDIAWMALRVLQPAPLPNTTLLRDLADALSRAVQAVKAFDKKTGDPLPPRKAVAPRQTQQTLTQAAMGTRNPTAAAMGVDIKGTEKRSKRKREDGDGELPEFHAGEESGLKAKPDARGLVVTSSGNFDVATFKLDGTKALEGLNLVQLQALCKHHGVTTARGEGKDQRMIERLTGHAPLCRCSQPLSPSHTVPSATPAPHFSLPTSASPQGQPTALYTATPIPPQAPPPSLYAYPYVHTQAAGYPPHMWPYSSFYYYNPHYSSQ